jgi:D-alanyl-D-alanine carboxypeptidase
MQAILQLYVVLFLTLGAPLNTLIDEDHSLPAWYEPGLREETLRAWETLQAAADKEDLRMSIYSGFRSYQEQALVFTRETGKEGEGAIFYSARPGHSEHQLGTALDVTWPGLPLGYADPRTERLYAWLVENAHQFGFVLSYPLKTFEQWPRHNRWMPLGTAFIHEPWHIRFVGVDLAQEIYEAGYLDPTLPVTPQDFYQPWP